MNHSKAPYIALYTHLECFPIDRHGNDMSEWYTMTTTIIVSFGFCGIIWFRPGCWWTYILTAQYYSTHTQVNMTHINAYASDVNILWYHCIILLMACKQAIQESLVTLTLIVFPVCLSSSTSWKHFEMHNNMNWLIKLDL